MHGTTDEIRKAGIKSTYRIDADSPIRKSHENPEVKEIYREFLKKPPGEKPHHLLHTTYKAK